MHRRAQRSLTCIDEALKLDPIPPAAILKALREFILEQWLPHLEWVDGQAGKLDAMHSVSQRITIWLDGACWVIRVLLPGLIVLTGVGIALGHFGVKLGLW